jgi:hypothetical protein
MHWCIATLNQAINKARKSVRDFFMCTASEKTTNSDWYLCNKSLKRQLNDAFEHDNHFQNCRQCHFFRAIMAAISSCFRA